MATSEHEQAEANRKRFLYRYIGNGFYEPAMMFFEDYVAAMRSERSDQSTPCHPNAHNSQSASPHATKRND